jgi:enhancing lycopene biosynthesis protein 2
MKQIGVFLTGCGALDGSDIEETVLLHYFLSKKGLKTIFIAPDINQKEVVNHLTQEVSSEVRNILTEVSRITKAKIGILKGFASNQIEGLILVGGEGNRKNVAEFDGKTESWIINSDLKNLIREMFRRKRPIGTCGLAALIVSFSLKPIVSSPLTLTLGNDARLIKVLEDDGCNHVVTRPEEAVMDEKHKIVSTPGSYHTSNIQELALGIENLVSGISDFIKK